MRILHLLSQIEVTGAETYATTLADAQIEQGHQVWIISDTLHTETKADYTAQPLHQRSFMQRVKNILAIRKFIHENDIQVVHAHSRASIWVGHFAVLGLKTPLISTIHGRQKPSVSKRLFDFYGDTVIAVCENAKQQLENAVKINPAKIQVIPNPVKMLEFLPSHTSESPVLTIAGRTTGPKGAVFSEFIRTQLANVLDAFPTLSVKFVGGSLTQLSLDAQREFKAIEQKYEKRIHWLGFIDNLDEELQHSSCVIAAGRIAIQTLAMGIPLIAIGEAINWGLVNEKNLTKVMNSNFGDMSCQYQLEPIVLEDLIPQLRIALSLSQISKDIVEKIQDHYALPRINTEILDLYRSAMMRKWHSKHIPVLMYHKVLPEPEDSQHNVYVTCHQFAQHMQFLANKGFVPLTFKEYFAFREGVRPLADFPTKPIFITFDDGYKNNLQNALPILQKHNFKAVLFALGDSNVLRNEWDCQQGEPAHDLMDAVELRAMAAAGVEIGAHTLSHPDLTTLSSEEAFYEIQQAKSNLQTILSTEVISFAYPFGYYNDTIRQLVIKAGYKCAVATDTGGINLEDDCFRIFRVNIMPRDKGAQFWKKTSSWYRKRYWRKRGK